MADHQKKRAAFEDITNSNREVQRSDKAENFGSVHAPGNFSRQFQNPVYYIALMAELWGWLPSASSSRAAVVVRRHADDAICSAPYALGGAREPVDIDAGEENDPAACSTYVCDIFEHLRASECRRRPTSCYMEIVQHDINPLMRSILVDWLVEVALEYRLGSETLFLSVAFVDRYLSTHEIARGRLQLLGVASMLIASKYEEIYAPAVDDFCYITDNTYARRDVLAQERAVLGALDYELTQPTTKTFLRRFIKAASGELELDQTFEHLCSYLAELTLLDYGMLNYLPSTTAAACVLVALVTLSQRPWTATLAHYTGYEPRDLRYAAEAVLGLFATARASSLPAMREKYASPKLLCVSALGVPCALPEWLF
ncbi:cyclin [Helicosporidium sp. ATCC 50920]|nr:cyclin [Helicosporidium sp. ATCC 50920]|eukprot:KDD73749.1 cyclin [Helicosporidium sp. ATCC 50920]